MPATLTGFDAHFPPLRRGIGLGFACPEEGVEAVAEVLAEFEKSPRPPPWGTYWAWCREQDAYVGLCGFKSPPVGSGAVEIAYYTFPLLRERGAATQMAERLVAVARSNGVKAVIAHSLPAEDASAAVLRRLGFAFLGMAQDADDGQIWAWRLALA